MWNDTILFAIIYYIVLKIGKLLQCVPQFIQILFEIRFSIFQKILFKNNFDFRQKILNTNLKIFKKILGKNLVRETACHSN